MIKMKWRLALISALILAWPTGQAIASFDRDLTLGSTGEDVRALQIKLNQDVDTLLSAAGPGAPGAETTYFGPITATAVKRFQEKYAGEILTPIGLSVGTGYVGAATRAKLNSPFGSGLSDLGRVVETVLVKTGSGATSVVNVQVGPTSRPVITSISPTTGRAGTKVTITGDGFAATGNTVYTGYDRQTVGSSDGRTIKFTFDPPFADEASGKASYLDFDYIPFRFYVGNASGMSEMSPEFKLTF